MKKLITLHTIKTSLLAAGLLAMTFVHAPAADTNATRVAVVPEAVSANNWGGYGSYLPTGYGQSQTFPGNANPWSTTPNGGYCPTCPQQGQSSYPYGVNYLDSTYGYGTDNFLPTGYQQYGLPGSNFPTPQGAPRDRNYTQPVGTSIPANWCPTGACPLPNSSIPGSNYPYGTTPANPWSTPYPANTFPSNTFPGSSIPSNGGYPYPNGTTPNVWPTTPYQPTVPQQVNQEDDVHAKITARYQSAEMLAFLNRMTMSQATNLYVEASRLIDTRHVSPTSYEVRTQRAIEGLLAAVQNPAFLQASRANPSAQQVQALQNELRQLTQTSAARTANEAVGVMQWAANLASQRIGVRPEAVALEFVNSTIDSLDKYSSFAPSKASYGLLDGREEWQSAALEENIVGVGVELKTHERGALILSTVENSPASRARLAAGDIITGVDGRNVQGMSLSQIAGLIAGPAGSSVTFRILRSGQESTVTMRRENVYVSSVAAVQMLDSTTGYARLKQFSESSAEDLEKAMWRLYQGGMKSMVLDLRGNPGGLLTEAVQVSNLFVPAGRIVATKGRTASDDSDERATYEKTWRIPLVVLVDENSASASEIFAAAIQENGRGVIVGRNTYGKGTVQTHFPLQSASGNLKLTTAKFYSPAGREIAGTGVRPDVAVNGKTDDFLAAGIARDQDVRTAMDVMARGAPASLAASAGQNGVRYDLSRLGN